MFNTLITSGKEALTSHGWILLWIGFAGSLWTAWHEHREIRKHLPRLKGRERCWAISKMIALWFLPLIVFLGTVGAQLSTDNLERKIGGRTLTAAQIRSFKNYTADQPKGRVNITSLAGDTEAALYAPQITRMLRESGYDVSESLGGSVQFGTPPTGIFVRIQDKESDLPWGGPLQRGLESIGIHAPGDIRSTSGPDVVEVFVAHKPPENP